jgi:serine/threonine-protein kinase
VAEPDVIAGKYRIIRPLGRGGMAEVFLARVEGVGGFSRQVVLKRLDAAVARDPDAVTLFLDEARTASRLHHQHIAQVFDFGHDDDGYFLAMEYLDGADARTLVRAAGVAMPVGAAVAITSAAALGLHHAHELAVIHRDVTGGNVFVTYDGAVKVIDFGIARAADRTTRTRDGVVRGTVAYMSPEQVQGFVLDRRSDLFSLGVVLYELVTGRRPFDDPGNSELVVMKRIEAGVHTSPRSLRRDLPGALDDLIERLLEIDPALRPASGEVLASALDAIARMPAPELGRYVRSIAPQPATAEGPATTPDVSGVETTREAETVSRRRQSDAPEPQRTLPGPPVRIGPSSVDPVGTSSPEPVGEPTGRTLPGPPVRLAAPRQRSRWPLVVGIGGLLAVVGIVGVAATRGGERAVIVRDARVGATDTTDTTGATDANDDTGAASLDASVATADSDARPTRDSGIGPESCLNLATMGIESAKAAIAHRQESAWGIRGLLIGSAAFLALDEQAWANGISDSCDGVTRLPAYAAAKRAYEGVERELVQYERGKRLVFTGTNRFGQLGYQDLDSGKILGEDDAKRR